LVRPFIKPILASIVIALLIYPVYKWFNKKINNRFFSALLLVVLFILVIAIPFGYVVNIAVREAYSSYLEAKKLIVGHNIFDDCESGVICDLTAKISDYLSEPETRTYFDKLGIIVNQYLFDYGSSFLLKIPGMILDLFVFLFFLFYLLKDGNKIVPTIEKLLPLDIERQNIIIQKTKSSIYSILYGQFLTAFVQGLVGGIGFFFLGLSSPLFWGIVMAFFSILPVGAAVIWAPAGIYLVLAGFATASNILVIKGIILLVYGLLIISTVDNVIRPKLIGDRLRAHPLLILVGLLGGIYVFGFFVGIFAGPLILTLLVAILEMYKEVKK
jgi:predicted PurR-regulated permease PerM